MIKENSFITIFTIIFVIVFVNILNWWLQRTNSIVIVVCGLKTSHALDLVEISGKILIPCTVKTTLSDFSFSWILNGLGECKLSCLDSLFVGRKPMVALSLVELPGHSGHLALAMGGLDNKVHIYSGERTGKVCIQCIIFFTFFC